ncbi:MAG: transglycosylase SLT domain-containing protein [Bacteroidaceae bacterium]|nr:transglycosylase SLT domain-containing protein [Bacteroidaceae bacterium]
MRNFIYVMMLVSFFWSSSLDCLAKGKNIEQIKAKHDYTELIEAIITVESKGDTKAVSPNGKCCGVLQITPILVQEVNNILGSEKYTLQDRFDREKSIEMFYIMQDAHNPTHDMRQAVKIWNRAEWYYKKVMNEYNKTKA